MRVLISNILLSGRTGTEMFVRDLAVGLADRGHQPMVWSPSVGPPGGGGVADDLRAVGLPVFDRLDTAMAPPDVIHGHHHDETFAALTRFPDRPGLFVLHDASAWHDEPPRHPRLLRHLAVDDLCRERLVASGVPERNIGMLRNAVDTDRFQPRGGLPDRPRRGLIFSHTAREETHVPAVREACGRMGMTLDVVGRDSGAVVARPEELLPGYDVVFAKGRSALEAAAVGCAVVVVDWIGLGGLLTVERFPEWRRWNLGRHLLRGQLTAEAICDELERYDPAGIESVRDTVRSSCSLAGMIDSAIEEYDGLRRAWTEGPRPDPRDELEAAAARLALIGPLRLAGDSAAHQARVQAAAAAADLSAAHAALDGASVELEAAREQVRIAEASRDAALGRAAAAEEQVEAYRRTRAIRSRDLLLRSPVAPWIRRLLKRSPPNA